MAKKVFRIHSEGALNEDWFSSTEINSNLIDSIHTDSGDGKKLPTSIPSPFARIDLVRTAFDKVAESDLEGLERNGLATATDNHKLISDALDIGQILFNYDKHEKDLKLIVWDKSNSLEKLLKGNLKQKHLGKTLKLFLDQDRAQYNFDQFDIIYILKYRNKIIGGTSPRTLFFAAPNTEETEMSFGKDIMLDDKLLPLYRRDKEYIKYLFSLSKTVNNFNEDFPEFNNYLIKSVDKLRSYNSELHNELMNLNYSDYMDNLNDVVFNNNAGEPLEIINGVPQKQYIKDPAIIEKQSDFVINTNKVVIGSKPLALPVESLNLHYTYTEDKWDVNTKVLAEDSRVLSKRTLPDQGDLYPYLTMNDFLTDTIIKLPYEIDSTRFLTVGNKNYLLPIKEEFFNYFSVEDIIDNDLIETKDLAGDNIEVKISIPIRKGFITYKKIYYRSIAASTNNDPTKGTIIEKAFALAINPFVKSDQIPITYSIGLADINPNKREILDISFFNTNQNKEVNVLHTSNRANTPFITNQNIVNKEFDAFAIKVGNSKNIIIPLWNIYNGNSGDNYEFAIDFGTTNSHIEYKIEGHGSERAYDISEGDEQIVFLMPEPTNRKSIRSQSIRDILDAESHLIQETISKKFGKDELRNSPFRTCLLQNVDVNYSRPTKVFSDANIGFDYEKIALRRYLKSYTDLKWAANDEDNNKRMEHYIEEMLMLCKNKVLLNDGNLSNTKITWFYPVSMTTHRLNIFRSIWQDKFKEVFNLDLDNLKSYPESIAPFYYFKEKGGIHAHAKPSVSIDIGGGTSDVMIFSDGEPQLITSFKFAGNSIFGDGFNGNIRNNGFTQKYYQKIKDLLAQNDLTVESTILDKIYDENASSSDLVNFFFSLKKNKNIKDKQIDLDFSKYLREDSDFKIIFLLFYSSIIYHIAELMKIKGMDTPRNILFSGTGSKTLGFLDSDAKFGSLTGLFEAIFNDVYQSKDSKITIKSDPNPKEVTSKGGFYIDGSVDITRHNKLIETNLGNLTNLQVQNRGIVTDASVSYNDVDKDFRKGVIDNVEEFYNLFVKLNRTMNFKDTFGVSPISIKTFNAIKSDDLEDFIMAGLNIAKNDSDADEALSETLFFYPLVGKLNELATSINEN